MKKFFLAVFLVFTGVLYAQNNYALAENYFRQGEYEKAIQIYKELQKKSPYNTNYLKRLVTSYQEIDQFDTADTLLQRLVQQNPTGTYLHVEIGFNYERQQKQDLAKVHYELALAGIERNPSLGSMTGRLFRNNNLLDYALSSYYKTIEVNPKSNFDFQIAQIYGEKGEFDKMFQAYLDLVDRNEAYKVSVQRISSRYLSDDPEDKNNVSFKKALLRKSIANPKNIWNELLSWLFAKQREYGKAFVQEKAIYRRNPETLENIAMLGTIAFDDSKYDSAKKCFAFVLENTSDVEEKIQAEKFIIQSEIELETENIISLFETTLTTYGLNSGTLPIQIDYADYLVFKKNDPKKAEEVLNQALTFAKSKFQKARIKLKLGDIFVFTDRFNKALIYFSQVQTQLKNHPLAQEARYKVARTSYYKGDYSWATAQLKVLKGSTTQLIANDAVDLFLIISDNLPKDSIPTGLQDFAKADLLSFQNKNKEAIAIYDSILVNYKGLNIEDESLFEQAKLHVLENDFDAAVQNLEGIIALNPEGIFIDDSYFLLAEIYRVHLKNKEKASEYYQKIIFEQPSSIYLVDARKQYRMLRGDQIN